MIQRYFVILILLFLGSTFLEAQSVPRINKIQAKEEFRWGVFAFHNGNYSDALLSFEKSISLDPEDNLTHFWLGLCYYVSGFESEALIEWKNLLNLGYNVNLLNYWISALEVRRSLLRPFYEGAGWEVLQEIIGGKGVLSRNSRPTVIRPDPEGGFYLVSFGTNQVQSYNANGILSFSIGERLEELSRPFDVLPVGKKIYVSEYGRDTISVFEKKTKKLLKRFGQSGIKEGNLLGPQYLAADSQGYIYVSEWGNQRISKFDQEGNFILSFGQPQNNFTGLEEPTGVTFYNGLIYIADRKKKELDVFDLSGNYLMYYPVNLEGLEGISKDNQQERLLLTTHKKLYSFEPNNQRLVLLQDLSKSLSKTLFYAYDANKQLLVGDFDSSRIIKMAPIAFLYEGLFIRLNRIISDNHPQIRAEVVVEDRYGNPIVGLRTENFILREGDYLLGEAEMEYAGYNAPDAGISFIFDKNVNSRNYLSSMQSVVKVLIQSLKGKISSLSFYSATNQPVLEKEGDISEIQAANLLKTTPWTENSQLDLTLSQSAAKLSKGPFKRSIIYLGSGESSKTDFSQYSLNELVELFKNHSISFYAIQFGNNISHELKYLSEQTGGKVIPYSQAEGVGGLIEEIYNKKNGLYLLKYNSPNDGELGYKYINLSVEVSFNKRTGASSLGYFAIQTQKKDEE